MDNATHSPSDTNSIPPVDSKNLEQSDSLSSLYTCSFPDCPRGGKVFNNAHDLKRHETTTHRTSGARVGCPFSVLGTGCDISVNLEYEATRYYDHLLDIHMHYKYPCFECHKTFSGRSSAHKHSQATGHRRGPAQWTDTEKEEQLRQKDQLYQRAYLYLLGRNAWNDTLPTVFREYESFLKRKKKREEREARKFRRSQATSSTQPQCSTLSGHDATATPQQTAVKPSRSTRTPHRTHPYALSDRLGTDSAVFLPLEDRSAACPVAGPSSEPSWSADMENMLGWPDATPIPEPATAQPPRCPRMCHPVDYSPDTQFFVTQSAAFHPPQDLSVGHSVGGASSVSPLPPDIVGHPEFTAMPQLATVQLSRRSRTRHWFEPYSATRPLADKSVVFPPLEDKAADNPTSSSSSQIFSLADTLSVALPNFSQMSATSTPPASSSGYLSMPSPSTSGSVSLGELEPFTQEQEHNLVDQDVALVLSLNSADWTKFLFDSLAASSSTQLPYHPPVPQPYPPSPDLPPPVQAVPPNAPRSLAPSTSQDVSYPSDADESIFPLLQEAYGLGPSNMETGHASTSREGRLYVGV